MPNQPYPVNSQRRGANSVLSGALRTHHADCTRAFAMAARSSDNRLQPVFKTLHGLAPVYVTNYRVEVSSRRRLRSSSHRRLVILPPSKTVMIGERSFAVVGPSLWNHLPDNVKETGSIELSKHRLKTNQFRQSLEIPALP